MNDNSAPPGRTVPADSPPKVRKGLGAKIRGLFGRRGKSNPNLDELHEKIVRLGEVHDDNMSRAGQLNDQHVADKEATNRKVGEIHQTVDELHQQAETHQQRIQEMSARSILATTAVIAAAFAVGFIAWEISAKVHSTGASAPAVAATDLGSVNTRIAALESKITSLETAKTGVDALTPRVTTLETTVKALPTTNDMNEAIKVSVKDVKELPDQVDNLRAEVAAFSSRMKGYEDAVKSANKNGAPTVTPAKTEDPSAETPAAGEGDIPMPPRRPGNAPTGSAQVDPENGEGRVPVGANGETQVAMIGNQRGVGRKVYLTPTQLESLSPDIPPGGDRRCVGGAQGYWTTTRAPNGKTAHIHRKCVY